ncbi:MBL fold metallo-hydrolase [Candidatus Geothermarchaeota archaeon ex4572_27]|nr:MAG: MBL fold metallo-hydrolase [Candidatus Geothermarchaeota archaeon ex4572_27]
MRLVDDEAHGGLRPAHGLSVMVKCFYGEEQAYILFDTGPGRVVVENAEAMGLDLGRVSVVALSHGHYDHTGGLIHVLRRIARPTPIVIDPRAFEVKLAYRPALTYIGLPFTRRQVEDAGGRLIESTSPMALANGVMVTGRIPRRLDQPSAKGLYRVEGGELVEDEVVDDRALIVSTGDEVVVITGCAHSGALNVVDEALRLTGANSIALLVGGLHLFNEPMDRVERVARGLRRLNVEGVAPCHCTGSRGIEALTREYGGRCTPLKAGSKLTLPLRGRG